MVKSRKATHTNQEFKQPPLDFQHKNTFHQQQENKPNLEGMMEEFLKDQEEQREAIKNLTSQMGQLFAYNKMLENQIAAQASSSK